MSGRSVLVRHAPAPKVAGDPLAVVVLAGEVGEVVDLVVEEADGADTKLQVPCKLRPS
jgi:hypothetical protein